MNIITFHFFSFSQKEKIIRRNSLSLSISLFSLRENEFEDNLKKIIGMGGMDYNRSKRVLRGGLKCGDKFRADLTLDIKAI